MEGIFSSLTWILGANVHLTESIVLFIGFLSGHVFDVIVCGFHQHEESGSDMHSDETLMKYSTNQIRHSWLTPLPKTFLALCQKRTFNSIELYSSCNSLGKTSCIALSLLLYAIFPLQTDWFFCYIFVWFLILLSLIDCYTLLLPDRLTQPLLWLGLMLSASGFGAQLESALYGAILGYFSLWALYWILKFLTGIEGIGYGDFKLLAALGAWLGWESLPALCALASLTGLVYSFFMLRRNISKVMIPFGPGLSFSGIVIYISQKSDVIWLMQAYTSHNY